MVQGTTVAVRLGMAMHRELVRLKAPDDLIADTQDAIDKLIVFVVQHTSTAEEKAQVDVLCDIVAQLYSTAAGVGWEQGMRKLGVQYADQT